MTGRQSRLIRRLSQFSNNWYSNYRYHGGSAAVLRCLSGTMAIKRGSFSSRGNGALLVDSITFSVVPPMTILWSQLIAKAITPDASRIIIGDCSGGMKRFGNKNNIMVIPLLNYLHGVKLDMFMKRVCRAKYVVVSDDDIFWMNERPWQWALGQLEQDPKLAVVSLYPRDRMTEVLRGLVPQPMGSFCLVINREIWLKERLSFQIDYSPKLRGKTWFYDTADLANVKLLERGYQVSIAPPKIRENLATIEGISTWTLKVQKHNGEIDQQVADVMIRQEKAFRALRFIKALGPIMDEYLPEHGTYMPPPGIFEVAERICRSHLKEEKTAEIQDEVDTLADRLQVRLQLIFS